LPALFGSSYGAFLALLAAAAAPDGWSACAAVAPFRSVEALYQDGGTPVRRMIDRLEGRTSYVDELGPRDLDRLVARIVAPVLIAHGEYDEVIPVVHGRALAASLSAAGHPDLTYREIARRGHGGVGEHTDDLVLDELIPFLTTRIARAGRGLAAMDRPS
jgi:pimeloyl-ACP methyl ester carboxylesterase